jgi:hypothetical protein
MKVLPLAVLSGVVFGALGTLCVVLAVLSIGRGQFPTAVVAIGGCSFCFGMIFPFTKIVPGNVTPRGAFDDSGTTIRPDRGIDIPAQLSLAGAVVAAALIVVLVPLGRLDIPVPPFMRLSLPFMSAVIVVTGAPMLWRNLRRGSTKYLRLTPSGFHMEQGLRSYSGDWAHVEDVTAEAPGQNAPTPNAVVLVMADGSAPTMAAASCTPDGTALRQLVRFYWQHPEYRGELTDGLALKRLADERFEATS